jgi:ribosome biogenesis GTPase
MRFSTAKQVSAARRQGGAIEFQMIAANVDYVIIVQSCHFDFNLKRLERYLVMVMDGGAEPYVLLTKTDLIEPDILAAQLSQMRTAGVAAPVLTLSNVTREGIDELKRIFLPGKTYCFVGSSGVGKSTIVNELIGQTCSKQRTSALQARAGTLLSAGN